MTHDTTPLGTAAPDPYAVPAPLDLGTDVVDLTAAVCDVASVSGDETRLADAVEAALRGLDHLEVLRDGDTVIARGKDGESVMNARIEDNGNRLVVLDGGEVVSMTLTRIQ